MDKLNKQRESCRHNEVTSIHLAKCGDPHGAIGVEFDIKALLYLMRHGTSKAEVSESHGIADMEEKHTKRLFCPLQHALLVQVAAAYPYLRVLRNEPDFRGVQFAVVEPHILD